MYEYNKIYGECKTCGKERRLNTHGNCLPCQAMHDYVPSYYYECEDCKKIMFALGWFNDCIYCESDNVVKKDNTPDKPDIPS